MSILKIARIGHPVVRGTARELTRQELRGRDVQRLIDDMVETMHEYDGVGVAAPQVHAPLRLAVIEVPASDMATEDGVPLTVLANPVVTPLAPEIALGFEGCLSVPGLRGVVPRCARLRYEGLDPRGARIVREVDGFHARVVQHECDHLDGRVYLDRMRDLRSLAFIEEFEKHALHAGDEEPGGADAGG